MRKWISGPGKRKLPYSAFPACKEKKDKHGEKREVGTGTIPEGTNRRSEQTEREGKDAEVGKKKYPIKEKEGFSY